MSKTIQVKPIKKGFKAVKIKVVANEHYVIVDESGKSFNKLKFVQVDKNLEIYADNEGKEQKIAILEGYYEPNMNASVVGIDGANNQEVGYILNSNDGWYYLGGELPETELGFAFPLAGIAGAGAAGAGIAVAAGGGGGGGTTPTDSSVDALNKIRDAAQNNNADTTLSVDIYSAAGITGVTSNNISSINSSLNTLLIDGTKADTKVEVQKIVDSYNKILAEANGPTTDDTPSSDPIPDDYTNIGADISIVTNNAETLKLLNDIIKTKERVDVDTVPEIEDLAKSAKDIIDVASGNKGGITPSVIINDLNKFGITANGSSINNLDSIQQQKILDAIKATDDSGSGVDTKQKLQDIVNNALKDTTAPDTPTITSDEYTTDTSPLITGIAESGSKVTVVIGGATYTTSTLSDGTWSINTKNTIATSGTLTTIAQTGTNVVVTATDSSNNVSSPATQILKVASSSPISGYDDNVGNIQSVNSIAPTTDDTTPVFHLGALPTNVKNFVLYSNGNKIDSIYDPINGTLTPITPLPDGVHNFTYSYTASKLKVMSGIFSLTIDTSAPIISIDSITNDNIVNLLEKTSGVVVSGKTDAEDGQSVTVVWGNTTKLANVSKGVWSIKFDSIDIPSDGTTTITANVNDKAGNPSIQANKIAIVDTIAPSDTPNPITSYEDNVGDITNVNSTQTVTDDTNPGFNIGTLPSGVSNAVLYVDGVKVDSVYDSVKGTLTPVNALSEGTHSIAYAYKDAAGNEGTLSTVKRSVKIGS